MLDCCYRSSDDHSRHYNIISGPRERFHTTGFLFQEIMWVASLAWVSHTSLAVFTFCCIAVGQVLRPKTQLDKDHYKQDFPAFCKLRLKKQLHMTHIILCSKYVLCQIKDLLFAYKLVAVVYRSDIFTCKSA